MIRLINKASLFATLLMMFGGSAWSESGLDPTSPEGVRKIEDFKTAYVSKCAEDAADKLAPKESPLRQPFFDLFQTGCSCGVDRALGKFTAEDYRTIELSMENEVAIARANEGTMQCMEGAAQNLKSQP